MDEERKKRLEELKQQSLELEKEAAEREKRNEERRKQREEQQRIQAEQEKKEEEERQKRREERRKKREEEEKALKEEMDKLENNSNRSGSTPQVLSPSSSSYSLSPENSGGDSSSSLLSNSAAREEREKRRKELEEESKRLEQEQQRIREEREKRKEERRLQQEEENKKLQELLDNKNKEKQEKEESDRLEKERLEKEKQEKEESERLEKEKQEKERLEREVKEKADKEEAERIEKEAKDKAAREESERIEKERLEKEAKEKADKEESQRIEKERLDREAKEKADKEEAERAEKERLEKEAKDKADKEESQRIEKERLDREAKEKADKEEAERAEKERLDREAKDKAAREEAERIEKERLEKETKEKADREEAERLEKERLDREAKEKAAREEAERIEKERLEKETKDKADKEEAERAEKERLDREAKEKAAREESERIEKERLENEAKEKAAREESQRVEKERLEKEAKEKADKELKEKQEKELKEKQEKELKEKQEKEAKLKAEKEAKEKADRELKEKQEKELKEKQEKEAKLKAEKEAKEKADKELKEIQEKEKQDKLKAEKEAKEKELKLKGERELKEKEERDAKEREKISKSVDKDTKQSAITDQFKLSIEKSLQNQLENKKKPSVTEDPSSSNSSSPSQLSSLTKDRAKIKGRQAPSKSHKVPGSATTTSTNDDESSSSSVLSQALENKSDNDSSSATKKKIVLPPGMGGLAGSMASLAMEAQKKKKDMDNNKLLANVLKESEQAPSFVRGRSQSVSVTSTLKQEPNKFVSHKKTVDTYSGLRSRLIHCKGKKRILTKEVEISIQSLNKCDAFVLDCGIDGSNVGGESADSSQHSNIFCWYGSKATANKKAKAVAIAEIIKSHERGGHATIVKLDEGDENELFYKKLGNGCNSKTPIKADGGDDLEAETNWAAQYQLLKYNSESDQLVNVESKQLSMELLNSEDFFVLDTVTEFYEWSGRNADQSLKETFHKKAQERLKNTSLRQPWVESIVISEGGESVLFREKFYDWPDLSHEVSLSRMGFGKKRVHEVAIPYEKKSPAKMNQFEVREMVEIERAEEVLKSDGSGDYEIWYVDNSKIHPLPKEEYGQFFSGNCYLIRYTYTKWNALKYAIYYWQGADASRQDVGSSSLLSKDLYIETSAKGECSQDPERQGRETNHFLSIFNGKMIVHRGERTSYQFTTPRLYHVFGRKPNGITASQTTKLSTSCLNSRDCFILTDSQQTFIWEGKGSTKQLKEESSKLATLSNVISKQPKVAQIKTIKEESEPDEFWKLIGGKTKYANYPYVHGQVPTDFANQIKLFAVVNTGSIIRADEIYRFNQYDLTTSKCYILDNRVNVFVWSGARAQEKEKKRGMEIAIEYLKYLKDSRSETDVLFINQGDEPLSFTCYFHAWDSLRFNTPNGADETQDVDITSPKIENAVNILKKYYQTLPFEKLIEKNTPPEIDRSVLEMYLSDEDFEKHLNMTKSEFEALPAWKRTEKKKVVGLF